MDAYQACGINIVGGVLGYLSGEDYHYPRRNL